MPSPGVEIRSGSVTARVQPTEMLPDGRWRGELMSYSLPSTGPVETLRLPMVLFDASGAVTDTVGYRELTVTPMSEREMTMVGNVRVLSSEALPSRPMLGRAGSDSVWVQRPVPEGPDAGTLTVVRITAAGDTLFHRELRYTPRAVDAAVADSLTEARIDTYRNRTNDLAGLTRAVHAMLDIPSFFPPVASITVAGDGSIWLRRQPADSDGWHWILLSPEGTPRGEVVTPAGASILWHDGDVFYAMEQDAFEVPWLVRYRLAPGG
jgi:hypothetical protein